MPERQWDQPGRASDGRDDELVEVVEDRARKQLAEWAEVAVVGACKRGEVAAAVALEDDRGGIAEPD